MAERNMTFERRPQGARVYDAAGGAEAAPLGAYEAHDQAEPAHDPELANLLTITLVAVLILGFVFGMVMLSSVF